MSRTSRDRGELVVVSTMKNEGPFILEWVAHYLALGFDHFVICTNDCEDTTVPMLRRLGDLGLVTHHATRVGRGGIHRSALRQAFRYRRVREAEWVFVCDVDEFLNIHVGDGSARALIEASGEADAICVPWRVFGPAGVTLYRDIPVTERFTWAELPPTLRPEAGKFVKSLVHRPGRMHRLGLHVPVPREEDAASMRFVWPGGVEKMVGGEPTGARPSFEVAQVNHYALRSLDSFLVKRARGRANHMNHVLGREYWDRFDLNQVQDVSIRRYETRFRGWLEWLKADEELFALHRKAVHWHRVKARQMRKQPDVRPLYLELRAEQAALFERLNGAVEFAPPPRAAEAAAEVAAE
ncbi:MAG: glycosyltransferase family 2 protein [Alphaproteobacteria bacterium]|nr:MAG: glycosyltransferase family 2 protein [Alphaproteobacteria bacterium]